MSSCGGSFCTYCRRASSAFATSVSSPTGAGRRCCRCASRSLGPRRVKWAGAGQSGNAEFLFGLGVIRLQLGVADGPVVEAGVGNGTPFRALHQAEFVEEIG